jgi:hypothetical protein
MIWRLAYCQEVLAVCHENVYLFFWVSLTTLSNDQNIQNCDIRDLRGQISYNLSDEQLENHKGGFYANLFWNKTFYEICFRIMSSVTQSNMQVFTPHVVVKIS